MLIRMLGIRKMVLDLQEVLTSWVMEWIQGSISRQEEIGLIVIYMAESDMRKSIILVMVDTKNEIRSAVFYVVLFSVCSVGLLPVPQYQLQKEKNYQHSDFI